MVMEGQSVDTVELQRSPITLQNGIPQGSQAPEQNFANPPLRVSSIHQTTVLQSMTLDLQIYEHFTYVDDPNVPPPTEEIEVSSLAGRLYLLIDQECYIILVQQKIRASPVSVIACELMLIEF